MQIKKIGSIQVTLISDLHRECYKKSKHLFKNINLDKLPKTEICILAGDIGCPLLKRIKIDCGFSVCPKWRHILKIFKSRYEHVLYIAGNHENYQAIEFKYNS